MPTLDKKSNVGIKLKYIQFLRDNGIEDINDFLALALEDKEYIIKLKEKEAPKTEEKEKVG